VCLNGSFDHTITITGPDTVNGEKIWKLTGTLPPGITFMAVSLKGVFSGTATTPGVYNFTISVTGTLGGFVRQDYTVSVATLTNTLPGATTGQPYSAAFTVVGFSNPFFVLVSGVLPDGLTLNVNGTVTGTPANDAVSESFEMLIIDGPTGFSCLENASINVTNVGCTTPTFFPTLQIPNNNGNPVQGLAYHPPTKTIWAGGYDFLVTLSTAIFIVDAVTGTLNQIVNTQPIFNFTGNQPVQILWDSVNDQMVVLDQGGNVAFINPYTFARNGSLLASVVSSNSILWLPMAYDSKRGNVLVLDMADSFPVGGKQVLLSGSSQSVLVSNAFPGNYFGSPVYCTATDKFYFSLHTNQEIMEADPVTLATVGTGVSFPNANEYALSMLWADEISRIIIGVASGAGIQPIRYSSFNPLTPALVGNFTGADIGLITSEGIADVDYDSCNNLINLFTFDGNILQFNANTLAESNLFTIVPTPTTGGAINIIFVKDQNLSWTWGQIPEPGPQIGTGSLVTFTD
jgi:hypothetical protein